MFQPHSFLWHYLWVAPNILLGVLAVILWRRGLSRSLRAFFCYAAFECLQWAVLYPIDLIPSVPATLFWRAAWTGLLIESILLFWLISDLVADVFGSYPALAHLGKLLIRWGGGFLLVAATAIAAFAPVDNKFWFIPAVHILQEAMYVVISGLMLSLFATAGYFHLSWNRASFGIAFGLALNACVNLAGWAITANGGMPNQRNLLDLLDLATFHAAVLIWFYYLLVPVRAPAVPAVPLPESNLSLWNRELERLLQQ
jgi:hypothetical protein